MRLTSYVCTLALGAIVGIGLVLSCGNNPKTVDAADGSDAAKCDCPAAEPPIVPSRIIEAKHDVVIPPNTPRFQEEAVCPGVSNKVVLNGGCVGNINNDIVLKYSYPGPSGWACGWSNNSNTEAPVSIVVHCLVLGQ